VALTVAGMCLAAIASLSNATLRSGLYVDRHLAAIEAAQQIIAGLPSRDQLVDGTFNGETDGHGWVLAVEPFPANIIDPGAPTRWSPKKIVVTVKGPTGSGLSVEMIRLVGMR